LVRGVHDYKLLLDHGKVARLERRHIAGGFLGDRCGSYAARKDRADDCVESRRYFLI